MNLKSSLNLTSLALFVICLSCLGYHQNSWGLSPFWTLQFVQWVQFVLIILITTHVFPNPTMGTIAVFYILSRIILFKSTPWIEDDYYRYLWDGHLVSEAINPYLLPPNDSFWLNVPSAWREHINFPDITTIYPPLTELYFAVIYLLFGESIFGLRVGCLIFEVLTGALIYKIIQRKKLTLKPLAIFLFFPTLLKENLNSVHFDLLAAFFILLFYFFFDVTVPTLKKSIFGWSCLAFAVLIKLFPLLLIPTAFFHHKHKWSGLFVFILLLMFAYYPFLDSGMHVFQGSGVFAKDWIFFESFYSYLQDFYVSINAFFQFQNQDLVALLKSGKLARLTMGFFIVTSSLVVGISKKLRLENKIMVIILLLFCCTTVLNSWYWLWILPLLILFAPRFAWLLPIYTTLGYAWFIDQNLYHQLHKPIYGFGILFVIIFILRNEAQKPKVF